MATGQWRPGVHIIWFPFILGVALGSPAPEFPVYAAVTCGTLQPTSWPWSSQRPSVPRGLASTSWRENEPSALGVGREEASQA